MDSPRDAAAVSVAEAGEIADKPDNVYQLAVERANNQIVGYIEQWNGAEWIYADRAATRWLQDRRLNEYSANLDSKWRDNERTGEES